MGQRIIGLLERFSEMHLQVAVDVDTPPEVGYDDCDIVIDFAIANATDSLIDRLGESAAGLVTGVTGHTQAHVKQLEARARRAPVLAAANFSIGIALLRRLVAQAARAAGSSWATEVFELHHGGKVDAPSGTALALGQAIAQAQGRPWPESRSQPRELLHGPRPPDRIGFASLRGGDVTGEHTVFLLNDGERLELTHRATNRDIFALGALRAAAWLHERAPGYYGIDDLLDI